LVLHTERQSKTGEIISGRLTCIECGREYRIHDGIARLLPTELACSMDESTEDADRSPDSIARKRSEMRARDAQAKDYVKMWYLNAYGRLEIPMTMSKLSLSRRHTLLEAGCGTGRMTDSFASKCRHLVSVDFSWKSLRVCRSRMRRAGITNVDFIQADLCHIPLASSMFDRVVSCGVLEHIPSHECQTGAVREMARVLRPGQKLVLSAYKHSLWTRFFGEKEGEHEGGIYFFRFNRKELHGLLESVVHVDGITGIMVYYFIAACSKKALTG
jgi:SAM-dependent methyltransferase/uncharacterized protein YbaR (Trm112 family)